MIPDAALQDPELCSLAKEHLRVQTKREQLALAADERVAAKVLVADEYRGQFTFAANISEHSVHTFIERLESWSLRNPGGPLEILLNSSGGSVVDGLALIDYIRLLRKRGHRITIVGVGLVASMAGAVLMSADERVLTSRCWMGLHEVSSQLSGSVTLQEDGLKFAKALQKQIVDLLCERSKITPEDLETRWARKDLYIDADEALELGLIDRIEEV